MKRTLITGCNYCAVVEDGILTEYLQADPSQQYGDILGGTVERIMPGIGCAFVNIGRKNNAFLPLRENSMTFEGQPLKSGMKIPVQIRKEETGSKGAFLTRDLTLAGKYMLLMPMNRYIGISAKITDEQEREKLRKFGQEISGSTSGLVMRTASLHADDEELSEEFRMLRLVWQDIHDKIQDGFQSGTVLYHQDPIKQMIRDYESMGTDQREEHPQLPANLLRQLQATGHRKVQTENGGNIVIDRCEAMTVIDVNSGSAGSGSSSRETYLETNLSACETISAQIRLRNLSGIILVDFIDMEHDEDRDIVAEKFASLLNRDRRKNVVHGWTKLGILEMTRKRTGSS